MVAEVSILSIGVGYEIGYADAMEKRVICLYDLNSEKQLSAMIRGNSKIEILEYTDINEALGDQADGWYMSAIAPIKKDICHVKARYSCYRPDNTWANSNNQYEVGVDYIFYKKVKAQLNYARVNNRSLVKPNYDMIDCQVSVSF